MLTSNRTLGISEEPLLLSEEEYPSEAQCVEVGGEKASQHADDDSNSSQT